MIVGGTGAYAGARGTIESDAKRRCHPPGPLTRAGHRACEPEMIARSRSASAAPRSITAADHDSRRRRRDSRKAGDDSQLQLTGRLPPPPRRRPATTMRAHRPRVRPGCHCRALGARSSRGTPATGRLGCRRRPAPPCGWPAWRQSPVVEAGGSARPVGGMAGELDVHGAAGARHVAAAAVPGRPPAIAPLAPGRRVDHRPRRCRWRSAASWTRARSTRSTVPC